MAFNSRRGGLRTISEHCPALQNKRLNEIAPVLAAIGKTALEVGKRAAATTANVGMAAGANLVNTGLTTAKGLGQAAKNAGSTLVKGVKDTAASVTEPEFNWTR